MTTKMKNKIFNLLTISIISVFVLTGCNDWLDVRPADKVLEDEMFETQKGFETALNGVYIELVSNSLYGSNLSISMVDVMAQYYMVRNNSDHAQRYYANYAFTDVTAKNKIEDIWVKAYKVIYNVNTIIEKAEADTKILSPNFREMILGECYGIRAMVHFDLLRLFGPIYKTDRAEEALAYQTHSDFRIEPILTAEAVVNKIIDDIKVAEQHLTNDPVWSEGSTYQPHDDGSVRFSYRQQRMNALAAKALKARVHLWSDNPQEALTTARDVINKTHKSEPVLFPFATYAESTSTSAPDRLFSSEILFGHYNSRRSDLFLNNFNSTLNSSTILTIHSQRLESMFDDDNDFRKKFWTKENVNSNEINVLRKYMDVSVPETNANKLKFDVMAKYIIPGIRVSEMYLIVAETTTDNEEALKSINALRNARNSISIEFTSEEKKTVIENEYRREFLGEGQMFYFYKRNGYQNLPNGSLPSEYFNINLSDYIIPLPDSETSQRN